MVSEVSRFPPFSLGTPRSPFMVSVTYTYGLLVDVHFLDAFSATLQGQGPPPHTYQCTLHTEQQGRHLSTEMILNLFPLHKTTKLFFSASEDRGKGGEGKAERVKGLMCMGGN